MKKFFNMVILVLLAWVSVVLPGDWHIETVDSEGDVGRWTSIAIDSNNYPHISYYDGTNRHLKYARYNGSDWEISTVDDSGYNGFYTSIALDSNDYPHISYFDLSNDNLKYARWTGSDWEIEILDSEGSAGMYTSIDLDSDDYPHISYAISTLPYGIYNLRYARFDGSEWHIETVDTAGDVGYYTSIALDSNDRPHISYCDESGALYSEYNTYMHNYNYYMDRDLKYARFDGSEWHIEKVDSEEYVGRYSSIAIDSNDHPHISYYHDVTEFDLKYARFDGSEWQIEVVESGGWVGKWTSIAMDSDDYPHISYMDYNNYDLKYARFDGSEWHIETVDEEGDVGLYTSIALDSGGYPHISYYDYYTNHDLKYAWFEGPYQGIDLVSFSAGVKGNNVVLLRWSISTDEGDNILGFNLYRRELQGGAIHKLRIRPIDVGKASVRENYNSPLQRDNIPDWQKVNNTLITGTNPYSYTDTGVAENTKYEYKLEAVMGGDSGETLGTTTIETGMPASFGIVRLYPNPCSDELNISLSSPDRTAVEIYMYDISGRCILSEEISDITESEADIRLNVSGLSSGIYTIKVVNVDGEVSSKRALVLR